MKETAERIFQRQRWIDITTAKSSVMWALLLLGEVTAFENTHEQIMGVGWILTCLTTTAMVLLRIDGANDSWRKGYKTGLTDAREQEQQSAKVLPFRG